jgi:cytochrome c oxidase cbb3-type subunit 3
MTSQAAPHDQAESPEASPPATDSPAPVPAASAERLMHHDYDGIREYDNPLPFWWSAIFVLCCVHAGWYLYWYHGGGPGKSEHQEYAAELAAWEKQRAAAPKAELAVDEAILTSMAADATTLDQGRAVFVKNCVSCHLDDGRGQIGPNLTDLSQIHGSTRMDLYQTIYDGVPDKGMLSWNGVLAPEELAAVAAYVTTLRGKQLAGKAAEGRPVEPFR